MDPFVGEIRLLPYSYAPNNWALCQGQLIPIQQNTALFSLLGTTYGGDGRTTFALPDLRGRVAVHAGQGPGLSNYSLGEITGTPTETLSSAEMPMHTHALTGTVKVSSVNGGAISPANGVWGGSPGHDEYAEEQGTSPLAADLITGISAPAGGGQPHENMMPYLALNYCIALSGVFPQRP